MTSTNFTLLVEPFVGKKMSYRLDGINSPEHQGTFDHYTVDRDTNEVIVEVKGPSSESFGINLDSVTVAGDSDELVLWIRRANGISYYLIFPRRTLLISSGEFLQLIGPYKGGKVTYQRLNGEETQSRLKAVGVNMGVQHEPVVFLTVKDEPNPLNFCLADITYIGNEKDGFSVLVHQEGTDIPRKFVFR